MTIHKSALPVHVLVSGAVLVQAFMTGLSTRVIDAPNTGIKRVSSSAARNERSQSIGLQMRHLITSVYVLQGTIYIDSEQAGRL